MDVSRDKLTAIVGEGSVVDDPSLLATFREAGATSGGEAAVVVRPHSTAEVRELVGLARSDKLNLVFLSSSAPR